MSDRPCLHCGRPEGQPVEIMGAGKVCAVSAFTYRPKPERSAEQERAAIVAWLREVWPSATDGDEASAQARRDAEIADAIERGDHLPTRAATEKADG